MGEKNSNGRNGEVHQDLHAHREIGPLVDRVEPKRQALAGLQHDRRAQLVQRSLDVVGLRALKHLGRGRKRDLPQIRVVLDDEVLREISISQAFHSILANTNI